MVDLVLEGTWAEGMLIGIPALTIVITVMVRIGIRVVGKVKQVRTLRRWKVTYHSTLFH